jgi:uncharacterized oligopeptide transporter (OPT) family protein
MPVAVGIYLPLELSVPIFIGGLVRWGFARLFRSGDEKQKKSILHGGTLLASGLIAGEAIMGIIIAVVLVGWGAFLFFFLNWFLF